MGPARFTNGLELSRISRFDTSLRAFVDTSMDWISSENSTPGTGAILQNCSVRRLRKRNQHPN